MDRKLDKRELLTEAKRAPTHESRRCIENNLNYRIFVGARDTYPENQQYFIDVMINLYLNYNGIDIKMMELAVEMLKTLQERTYFVTSYYNGTVTCEIETDEERMIPLLNEVCDALNAINNGYAPKMQENLATV